MVQRQEYVGAFANLTSALNDRPNLDRVYRTACEGLARALSIETSFILLFDRASQAYRMAWIFPEGAYKTFQTFPAFTTLPIEKNYIKTGVPNVIHSTPDLPYLADLKLPPSQVPQVFLLTALHHEGERIGVLGACTTDPGRAFPPDEIIRAQTIADQVTVAIVYARLFQAAQKQAFYLELTNEITQIALQGGSLKDMLGRLAQVMVNDFRADGCYISQWDSARQALVPFTASGREADNFLHPSAAPGKPSLRETALNTGRLIFTGGPALPAGRPGPEEMEIQPKRAVIALPLRTGDQKLGAIQIEYLQPHPFLSSDDQPHWEKIASQITLAMINILAIESEKKRRLEAELLQQATAAISSSLELEEILRQLLTSLGKGVPFDSAAICLLERGKLRIAALGGSAWHTRQVGDSIDPSAGLFSLLKNTHVPVFLADAQLHPNYEHWSQSDASAIHGWMGVPLMVNDRPIGYLLLNSREVGIYTPDHARLAHGFASRAALAIDKARLFDQVRSGRERLQILSKKLVEVQEAERAFISHELHDEIGQELTGLQFILEMGKESPEADRLSVLSEAQALVTGLMSQIRELSFNLHPSMIDDLGLLSALNAHFTRFQQKTGIQVRFVYKDPDWHLAAEVEVSAFRVVQEALTNVARYAGVKEVEVHISKDAAALKIVVRDRGKGFDIRSLKESSRSFGIMGMRERTELVGGKFELVSKPGEGTQISAVFPTGQKLERRKNDRTSSAG